MLTLFIHYKDGDFQPVGHVKSLKIKENYIEIKQDLERPRRIYKQLLTRIWIKSGKSSQYLSFSDGNNELTPEEMNYIKNDVSAVKSCKRLIERG